MQDYLTLRLLNTPNLIKVSDIFNAFPDNLSNRQNDALQLPYTPYWYFFLTDKFNSLTDAQLHNTFRTLFSVTISPLFLLRQHITPFFIRYSVTMRGFIILKNIGAFNNEYKKFNIGNGVFNN